MANQKAGIFTPNGKSEQRGCRKFDIKSFENVRLESILKSFIARRKAMGMKDKKLWKILCEEFRDGDITKLLIDYDRYGVLENKTDKAQYIKFIKSHARAAISTLAQFCYKAGIGTVGELCSLYSAEEIAEQIYGIGVVKLQAFCTYCVILEVPFYMSKEDRLAGKFYEYKKPAVKRGRKTTETKGVDK